MEHEEDDIEVDVKPDLKDANLFTSHVNPNDEGSENLDSFYFETDQFALKNNPDYQALLGCLAILQSQRLQASKDLDLLIEKKKEALKDPISFVTKLQLKDKSLKFPPPLKIPEIPTVNWKKYMNEKFMHFNNNDVNIRNKSNMNHPDLGKQTLDNKNKEKQKAKLVSHTHNQPWSVEEQKLLDTLLIKYPPERFEARRWFKIAQELKTRTPQQVASRVQKYFLKLASQGLPIPGRQPTSASHLRKALQRNHKYYKYLNKKSTFLTSYEPPVSIPDDFSTVSDI